MINMFVFIKRKINTVLSILSFIIGVAGLIAAFYFYYGSQKKKEISYNTDSPSFLIYYLEAFKRIPSFRIVLPDSTTINEDVYLTTFSIENSGDLPINMSDVRKKVNIEFLGIKQVLDVKIINEIEKGVSNFRLMPKNKNSYELVWDYFDPNNAFEFQLIYLGDEVVRGKVTGIILDTQFHEYLTERQQIYSEKLIKSKLYKGKRSFPIYLLIISILFIGMVGYAIKYHFYWKKIKSKHNL